MADEGEKDPVVGSIQFNGKDLGVGLVKFGRFYKGSSGSGNPVGWMCPVCGRGVAPSRETCPCVGDQKTGRTKEMFETYQICPDCGVKIPDWKIHDHCPGRKKVV